MLSDNIEKKVREILETQGKGGWLRTNDCANLFAKGNATKKTTFYRWRRDIEKGKVKGFQIVQLPKNVSFIGLDSSSPKKLQELKETCGPPNFIGQGVEKKEENEKVNLELRIRQCKMDIRRLQREYYRTQPQKNSNTQIPFDVQVEIEKKCRKKYGLSPKEPL
jgi:hypothetical protein